MLHIQTRTNVGSALVWRFARVLTRATLLISLSLGIVVVMELPPESVSPGTRALVWLWWFVPLTLVASFTWLSSLLSVLLRRLRKGRVVHIFATNQRLTVRREVGDMRLGWRTLKSVLETRRHYFIQTSLSPVPVPVLKADLTEEEQDAWKTVCVNNGVPWRRKRMFAGAGVLMAGAVGLAGVAASEVRTLKVFTDVDVFAGPSQTLVCISTFRMTEQETGMRALAQAVGRDSEEDSERNVTRKLFVASATGDVATALDVPCDSIHAFGNGLWCKRQLGGRKPSWSVWNGTSFVASVEPNQDAKAGCGPRELAWREVRTEFVDRTMRRWDASKAHGNMVLEQRDVGETVEVSAAVPGNPSSSRILATAPEGTWFLDEDAFRAQRAAFPRQ